MRRAWLLAMWMMVACGGSDAAVARAHVRVEGRSVWIDGDVALRGVQLELAWDEGVHVTAIEPGVDTARLDLVRARLADDGRSARVIVSDTRRVALPGRGELVHVVAEGDGALRVVAARAAGADLMVEAAP